MNCSLEIQIGFPQLLQIALDLFRRPSPSGHEELMRDYVRQYLTTHGFTVTVDRAGNVLACRGTPATGEGYPLLSFHLDCVSLDWRRALRLRPPESLAIERGWLHSWGRFVLGGDDKCGGAIALTLATMSSMPLKIVASVEEEVGCLGIEQVDPRFFEDVAYALVLDRRGANHLVVSIAGSLLCQGAFAAALMRAAGETGLVAYAVEGAFSDALALSHMIENVANLSVGYYHPHSVDERVSLADLCRSYLWVKRALESLPTSRDAFTSPLQCNSLICPGCQRLVLAPGRLVPELQSLLCHCAESGATLIR
jgi:putative aminopeptidase FrvX